MRPIVYDVAMTLDGYISHEDGSADGFVPEGDHVAAYLERLQEYDTVLMGRKTYEFGYQYGLQPGERAYSHMEHYIFSTGLSFETDQVNVVEPERIDVVRQLKEADGAPIYLCGGGQFAGTLLEHELIDRLVIKLNPILFGAGIRLFGASSKRVGLAQVESTHYESGVMLLRYDVDYGS